MAIVEIMDFKYSRFIVEWLQVPADKTYTGGRLDFSTSPGEWDGSIKQGRFRKLLHVRLATEDDQKYGWLIDIELVGIFFFRSEIETGELKHFLETNALTLLYGIARGHVASQTALFESGKIVLPSIDFASVFPVPNAESPEVPREESISV